MKHLLWILLFILTSCATTNSATRATSSYIKDQGSKTVALVFQVTEEETKTYCTGVWVGDNIIITASHCIEGVLEHINEQRSKPLTSKNLRIHYIVDKEVDEVGKNPTGTHLGTCIGTDSVHDLALIRAEGNNIPTHGYAELSEQTPAIGEKVTVTGHPTGLYWSYIEGIVSAHRADMPIGEDRMGPYIQVSIPVWYGNSGGGLFDSDGKLVGIASFIAPPPNTAFFIDISSIRDFLKAYKVL